MIIIIIIIFLRLLLRVDVWSSSLYKLNKNSILTTASVQAGPQSQDYKKPGFSVRHDKQPADIKWLVFLLDKLITEIEAD